MFPAVFNATMINGTNGFIAHGLDFNDNFGAMSVGGVGDINGDGIDDILMKGCFEFSY